MIKCGQLMVFGKLIQEMLEVDIVQQLLGMIILKKCSKCKTHGELMEEIKVSFG